MIHISKLGSEIITFVCLFQPFWMDFRHKGLSGVVLKVVLLAVLIKSGRYQSPALQIGKREFVQTVYKCASTVP